MPSSHERRTLRARRRQLALQHEWLAQLALQLVGGPDDPPPYRAELLCIRRRPTDAAVDPSSPGHHGELAFIPLEGDDPVRALFGRTVPPHVDAVGLVAPATAWSVVDRVRHAEGAFVHLVTRDGAAVTVVPCRFGDPPHVMGPTLEPQEGRVPDACRRILGLPTAPPPPSCTDLALDWWLDDVLATAVREPATAWEALATASPVVTELAQGLGLHWKADPTPADLATTLHDIGEAVGWEVIRAWALELLDAGTDLPHLLQGLDRETVEWTDLGMFARLLIGERLPVGVVLDALESLLGPTTFDQVTATISLSLGSGDAAVA